MKRAVLIFMAFILGMFAHVEKAMAACDDGTHAVIDTFDGVNVYSNDPYTGTGSGDCQCTELISRFYHITHTGNGYNVIYVLQSEDGFSEYENGKDTTKPEPGDVISFSYGTYGHVALVTAVTDTTVEITQQNWPADSSGSVRRTLTLTHNADGTYTVGNLGATGSYVTEGWARDPSSCTDHTYSYDYGINVITVQQGSSNYTLTGYYTDGSGDSTSLVSLGTLKSGTGTVSTHKAWLTGDVDGDSDDDIVEITDSGSYTYAYVYKSDGVGGFSDPTSWVKTTTGVFTRSTPTFAAAFLQDMDADGDADLILGYKNSDTTGTMKWKTYTSTGSSFGGTTNGTIWSSSFGNYTDLFQLGDYNDNGKGELLCGREADGTNNYTSFNSYLVWKRLASGGATSTVDSSYGYSGDAFISADVNNDGNDDLVRVNLYNSTVGVYAAQYSSTTDAFGSASKMATDVGGVDGSYYLTLLDIADDYSDLLRLNSSGSLYFGRNASGTSFEEQSDESVLLSGMASTTTVLFGDFGTHTETETVCE